MRYYIVYFQNYSYGGGADGPVRTSTIFDDVSVCAPIFLLMALGGAEKVKTKIILRTSGKLSAISHHFTYFVIV